MKLISRFQHEKWTSGIYVTSLNSAIVTNDNNAEIPTKSKRLRKAQIAGSNDFLW